MEAHEHGERERASRPTQEGPRVQERRGNQEREEQGQHRAGSVRARVVPRVQRAEFAVQRVALRRCVFPKDDIVEFDLNVVAWIFEWYQREVCG